MAEIGIILTVQRSLILGRVTEERRKNIYFAKSYGRHRQGTQFWERLVTNFSELRIEVAVWEIALKKATGISWGPRTFYKPCLFTHTTNFHLDMHCSVLPTFSCDTLIPPCLKQVFPQSGPAYNEFMDINSYSTTHRPHSDQENKTFIAFYL